RRFAREGAGSARCQRPGGGGAAQPGPDRGRPQSLAVPECGCRLAGEAGRRQIQYLQCRNGPGRYPADGARDLPRIPIPVTVPMKPIKPILSRLTLLAVMVSGLLALPWAAQAQTDLTYFIFNVKTDAFPDVSFDARIIDPTNNQVKAGLGNGLTVFEN